MTLYSEFVQSPQTGAMSKQSPKLFKQQRQQQSHITFNHSKHHKDKLDDTDSGFLSRATSIEKLSNNSVHDTISTVFSIESLQSSVNEHDTDKRQQSERRSSSGQKLAKLLNVFTPCRNRIARRSRSFGDINKTLKSNHKFNWKFNTCSSQLKVVVPTNVPLVTSRTTLSISRKHDDILNESIRYNNNNNNNNNSNSNNGSPSSSIFFNSNCSYSTQLDIFIAEPNQDLYEFRRRYPSQFLALVTNYLGFLVFTSDELDQIREILTKDAKQLQNTMLISSATSTTIVKTDPATNKSEVNDNNNNNSNTGNNINESSSKTQYTPRKMLSRLREQKQNASKENEINYWYTVVNAILRFMLRNENYKHRFIFRRPGNQSNVNNLEKILFHQPGLSSTSFTSSNMITSNNTSSSSSLSFPISSNSLEKYNSNRHYENQFTTEMNNIDRILHEHDPSVIACLLARILRRQGIGLIPNPLRRLFIQLISSIKQNEIYQRRAIRLLFLLCPIRLVQQIMKPLFELMAKVANEPECEVDETSLAVLFSPIFFLDRSTTTPISLANPLPIHVLNLCVRLARDELKTNLSVARLFQIPSLFLHDCTRNLILHQTSDSPALCCSLKYCVTMTPSPRSQGKKSNESLIKSDTSTMSTKSNNPIVNLTAAFLAKRPRAHSPAIGNSKDCVTPLVKNTLHGPTLDFRIRRTPTHTVLRNQSVNMIRSPVSAICGHSNGKSSKSENQMIYL
uniref:Rho-GAP domain-containing protein n=1 Tax=Schistosoma mansoni TaxID=6183 RepID=A0A3Q0KRA3_SCHMA